MGFDMINSKKIIQHFLIITEETIKQREDGDNGYIRQHILKVSFESMGPPKTNNWKRNSMKDKNERWQCFYEKCSVSVENPS